MFKKYCTEEFHPIWKIKIFFFPTALSWITYYLFDIFILLIRKVININFNINDLTQTNFKFVKFVLPLT